MSTERDDPLEVAPEDGLARPHYAQGAMLDDRDFGDEQGYHRSRLARALRYLFGPGTVAGTRVSAKPIEGDDGPDVEIEVDPGLAIDPLGRLIEIPRRRCIRVGAWYAATDESRIIAAHKATPPAGLGTLGGVVADVFVRFRLAGRGLTPAFASGPFDATDAARPSRIRDEVELSLVPREEANPPKPPDTLAELFGPNGPAALRERVLDAWHETRERDELLPPLPEHATGMDARLLVLARVLIPTGLPTGGKPALVLTAPVAVDNAVRRVAFAPGAWAWIAP